MAPHARSTWRRLGVLLSFVNGRLGSTYDRKCDPRGLPNRPSQPMICLVPGNTRAAFTYECDIVDGQRCAAVWFLETQTPPDGCRNKGVNSGIGGHPYDNLMRRCCVVESRLCCGRSRGQSGGTGSAMWIGNLELLESRPITRPKGLLHMLAPRGFSGTTTRIARQVSTRGITTTDAMT
ncbi:hypothetical protein B0T16DRAFT_171508 [Cercophora newfieldiana]|uniref:Secreted protein n=1 Tax=Cercophora newfieldiana TaxID=92897 RepID=A0AA40CRZ5_9PEZI|nr:hypothetical protein B0T16DRAFT_171508 [Cercophora newfieldiana]